MHSVNVFTRRRKASRVHLIGGVIVVSVLLLCCLLCWSTAATPTVTRVPSRQPLANTPVFRPLGDEVNCTLVLLSLRHLLEESAVRRAAWSAADYDVSVEDPRGLNVTELHLLMIGDSWARRYGMGLLRHIDQCRMALPTPLVVRDECALHFVPEDDSYGHALYQLSKAALGMGSTGFLRVHLQYRRHPYRSDATAELADTMQDAWPTPSTTSVGFPRRAQCRRSLDEGVREIEHQVPLCLCQDTIDADSGTTRRVPVDAVQLFHAMSHALEPTKADDLFTLDDKHADWYLRQARFSPNRAVYPYLTWEENLERLRQFQKRTYVEGIRRAVATVAAVGPKKLPMPRVLLSRVPKVNCSSEAIHARPSLGSSSRCEELVWPLQRVDDELVRAAYGEPLLGLPAVQAPEWLRLVDYRLFSATEHPDGAQSGAYLCRMDDGFHLETLIHERIVPPHVAWCARHTHQRFWEEML